MIRTLALLTLVAGPAIAQQPPAPAAAPVCVKAEIVPGLEGWWQAGGTALAVGLPATLTLAPAVGQTFTPPLGKPPAEGSFGGTFALTIAKSGTYRIALSPGAWIDVVAEGKKLASISHGHGPACSGIAKIVDFTLSAGTYQVQLSSVKQPTIKAMVAPKA